MPLAPKYQLRFVGKAGTNSVSAYVRFWPWRPSKTWPNSQFLYMFNFALYSISTKVAERCKAPSPSYSREQACRFESHQNQYLGLIFFNETQCSVIAVQAPLVHDFEWWRNLWKDEWKLIWSSSENTRSPWLVFSPLMYWAEHNTNPDHYQIMGKTSLFLELHFSGDLIIGLQIRWCIGGAPAQCITWSK